MKTYAPKTASFVQAAALALAGFAAPAIFAAPASATTGREAVRICIDSTASGARCSWSVNDKGEIDICNASGCVYCPSAESECTTALTRPPGQTTNVRPSARVRLTPRAPR